MRQRIKSKEIELHAIPDVRPLSAVRCWWCWHCVQQMPEAVTPLLHVLGLLNPTTTPTPLPSPPPPAWYQHNVISNGIPLGIECCSCWRVELNFSVRQGRSESMWHGGRAPSELRVHWHKIHYCKLFRFHKNFSQRGCSLDSLAAVDDLLYAISV